MNYQHDHWRAVRAFYQANQAEIMKSASEWGVDPYEWEQHARVRMTPIESALWGDIRLVGLVLYAQYPVGRFFVDFGNPVAKVAIECDGAAYHLDAAKDAARERELNEMGWKVYRISGRDCLTDTVDTEDENGAPVVELGTAMKFMREIAKEHPHMRLGSGRAPSSLRLWGGRA